MKKKYPLITVCIPAYNHGQYVQECLQSVIDQDYPLLELVLINDGSTDDTWAKVLEMEAQCRKRFARVVFLNQDNLGSSRTFEFLFTLAQGEYIALSASDDKFLPGAITNLYNFLVNNQGLDLVVGRNLIIDSESRQCYWDKKRNNIYKIKDSFYQSFTDQIEKDTGVLTQSSDYGDYESLLRGNHIANGWLFRKSVLKRVRSFTPEAPLEDWWFMLQISKVSKIAAIPEETFCYRWHSKNTMRQKEKINQFKYLTLQHEERCLIEAKDEARLKTFRKVCYFEKPLLRIGSIFELFIRVDLVSKKKILKILNREFVLKAKYFTEDEKL